MTGRTEAVGWLEQALELDGADDVARADVTMGLALLLALWELGTAERAQQLITTAVHLADRAGDSGCRSWAHFFHGEVLSSRGDHAGAHAAYRAALSFVQQPARAAAFHHSLGWVALAQGDVAGARAEFETAVAYGDDGELHVTHALAALAILLAGLGVCDRAASLAKEAVAAARRFRLPGVLVMALTRSTQTLLRCGDDPGARETLQELFTLLHQLGTFPFRPRRSRQWPCLPTAPATTHVPPVTSPPPRLCGPPAGTIGASTSSAPNSPPPELGSGRPPSPKCLAEPGRVARARRSPRRGRGWRPGLCSTRSRTSAWPP